MKRLILAGLGAVLLSGCMGTHLKKLALCDGKHRRPANAYGSILPTLPVPVPPSEAASAVSNPPSVSPAPQKTSLLEQQAYFVSC